MNTPTFESTPVELTLDELAQVGGAAPRGGWETDPTPIEPTAVAPTADSTN